jgi:peroxiredoxin
MRHVPLAAAAILAAAGCATNDRVDAIDHRLDHVEETVALEARLTRIEARARAVASVRAETNDPAEVRRLEERIEALRLQVERLEGTLNQLQRIGPAPAAAPVRSPVSVPTATDGAASVGTSWTPLEGYGGRTEWGYLKKGDHWSESDRILGKELVGYYGKGEPCACALDGKDQNGAPWKPRAPGATGQGMPGTLDLVGQELLRTRFLAQSGRTVDVRDLRGKKNVVIVILRGFDPEAGVCIACTAQTLGLLRAADEFAKRDAEVFLVYPGAADTVPKFLDAVSDLAASKDKIPLDILLDVDLAVVRDFKIEGHLARPTTVIVDKKGIVRFAHMGRNKTDRPTVPEILAVLDGFGS